MLFNSWTFAVFFAIVVPLYYALGRRRQNAMLLVASYVFYGWWDWRFLILLMLSTTVDFFVARWMNQTIDARARKLLMLGSVGLNLTYLGFFKYFNFFSDSLRHALKLFGVAHLDYFTVEVLLPVGISFYTFQSISAGIVDVYRNSREHTEDYVAFAAHIQPEFSAPGGWTDPAEHATSASASATADGRAAHDLQRAGVDADRVFQEDRDRRRRRADGRCGLRMLDW